MNGHVEDAKIGGGEMTVNNLKGTKTTIPVESSALQLQALQELRTLRDNMQSELTTSTSREDEEGLSVAFVNRFSSIEKLSLRLRGSYSSEEEDLDSKSGSQLDTATHLHHRDDSLLRAQPEASPRTESESVDKEKFISCTERENGNETSREKPNCLPNVPRGFDPSNQALTKHGQRSENANLSCNQIQEGNEERATAAVSVKEVSADDYVGFETSNCNHEGQENDYASTDDCKSANSTPSVLTSFLRPALLNPRLQSAQSTPPKLPSPLVAANRLLHSRSRSSKISSLSINSGVTYESAPPVKTTYTDTSSGQRKFQLKIPGMKKTDRASSIKVEMVQQNEKEADGCMEVQILPGKKKDSNPFKSGKPMVVNTGPDTSSEISKEVEEPVSQKPAAELRRKGNSITVNVIESDATQGTTEGLQHVSVEVTEVPTPKRFPLKMKLRSPRFCRSPSSEAQMPCIEQSAESASDTVNTNEAFSSATALSSSGSHSRMFPPISPRKKGLQGGAKDSEILSTEALPKNDGEPNRRFDFSRILSKHQRKASFAKDKCDKDKSEEAEDRVDNSPTIETLAEESASFSTLAEEKKSSMVSSDDFLSDIKTDHVEEHDYLSKSGTGFQEDLGESRSSSQLLSSYEYDSLASEESIVLSSHVSSQESYRYAESNLGSPTSARSGVSEVLSSDCEFYDEDEDKGIYDEIREGVGELLSPKNAHCQYSPSPATRRGSSTVLDEEKVQEIAPIFSFSALLEKE